MSRLLLGLSILLILPAAGCKEPGTQTISLDGLPAECSAATHVAIHLVRDLACPSTPCEAIAVCNDDNCTPVCDGLCSVDELRGDGLRIVPPSAGLYAVVVQLAVIGDGGVPTVLCSACGQAQLDADGTASSAITAAGASCTAALPPDAGADAGPDVGPDAGPDAGPVGDAGYLPRPSASASW